MICGYLTVWTFVGIIYNTWVTPVKNTPGVYNTRTSLGPWADRIGVLAYALTPLSVLLSSRESLLSIITGLPYQSFMFLHRWLGYVIIIQSSLHTIGWCIVEWRLYQPQPTVWNGVISQLYIIWGVVAMVLLLIMYLLSMPWAIQVTGYEFFKKSHYVLAMVYIGAVIGHWSRLECFLIPGLVLWFLDRLARVIRTGFLHFKRYPNEMVAFKPATATISLFPDQDNGDVVRLDFQHVRGPWKIGQHFYLCFCESSIWQSHPMTPVSLPVPEDDGRLRHAYVIRVRKGETRRIALLATRKAADLPDLGKKSLESQGARNMTTPVILNGPYGTSVVDDLTPDVNVLCIAGGTGVTFVLPVLLRLAHEPPFPCRKIDLVWSIRREQDVRWVAEELKEVRGSTPSHRTAVHIYVTRQQGDGIVSSLIPDGEESKSPAFMATVPSTPSVAPSNIELETESRLSIHHPAVADTLEKRRPHLQQIVEDFIDSVVRGPTIVFASGPVGMIADLRDAVASCNSGSRVWRGDSRFDVRLVCDDRLE
ncbi:Ferric-chelate reductase [Pleurostoma richardsiae]|uniref:Ferric-chelate reductase n=1 Tax=Pleurostoma richardsiae TaxID=41990 RepID=A0AA38RKC3_9PEZI|nr:Ferric-chelate reductase [Pleurostoma richardsiae]